MTGPTEQELRCAELLRLHLGEASGGEWQETWLDAENPSQPSPDVLLTDGAESFAVEIKQLTDGETIHAHNQAIDSLRGSLAPQGGGTFYLSGPRGITPPLDRALVKELRTAIEEVAPELDIDKSKPLPVTTAIRGGLGDEEWKILRVADTREGGSGVWLVTAAVDDPEEAARSAVLKGIGGAKRKFASGSWQGRWAAALHVGHIGWVLDREYFEDVVASLNSADVAPLEIVFVVAEDGVSEFSFG